MERPCLRQRLGLARVASRGLRGTQRAARMPWETRGITPFLASSHCPDQLACRKAPMHGPDSVVSRHQTWRSTVLGRGQGVGGVLFHRWSRLSVRRGGRGLWICRALRRPCLNYCFPQPRYLSCRSHWCTLCSWVLLLIRAKAGLIHGWVVRSRYQFGMTGGRAAKSMAF